MSHVALTRVLLLVVVLSALPVAPARAEAECFQDMAGCFGATAMEQDGMWGSFWSALDCELSFVSCVRFWIIGR